MENINDLLKEFPVGHKFQGITVIAVLLIHGYNENIPELIQLVPVDQISKILQASYKDSNERSLVRMLVVEKILRSYKFATINQLFQALPPESRDLVIQPFLTEVSIPFSGFATAFLDKATQTLKSYTSVSISNLKDLAAKAKLVIQGELAGGFTGSYLQLYAY